MRMIKDDGKFLFKMYNFYKNIWKSRVVPCLGIARVQVAVGLVGSGNSQ